MPGPVFTTLTAVAPLSVIGASILSLFVPKPVPVAAIVVAMKRLPSVVGVVITPEPPAAIERVEAVPPPTGARMPLVSRLKFPSVSAVPLVLAASVPEYRRAAIDLVAPSVCGVFAV
jgi:hypothetical protein